MQKGASAIPVRLSRVCLSPAATATARIGPKRVAIPIILAIEDGPSREHYGSVGEGSSPSSSGRGRRGVLIVSHDRSRMTIDPCILQCRDGARRVFTDQADIACNKREAP